MCAFVGWKQCFAGQLFKSCHPSLAISVLMPETVAGFWDSRWPDAVYLLRGSMRVRLSPHRSDLPQFLDA